MIHDFSRPTWTQVGEMQNEIDTLHQENGLKLNQILNLEELIWSLRLDFLWPHEDRTNNDPCWCGEWDEDGGLSYPLTHSEKCIKAREATKMFWVKSNPS